MPSCPSRLRACMVQNGARNPGYCGKLLRRSSRPNVLFPSQFDTQQSSNGAILCEHNNQTTVSARSSPNGLRTILLCAKYIFESITTTSLEIATVSFRPLRILSGRVKNRYFYPHYSSQPQAIRSISKETRAYKTSRGVSLWKYFTPFDYLLKKLALVLPDQGLQKRQVEISQHLKRFYCAQNDKKAIPRKSFQTNVQRVIPSISFTSCCRRFA